MKIITRTAAAAMLLAVPMMSLTACGSDSKPSKADVQAGYVKMMKTKLASQGTNVPDATLNKYTGCVLDKSYDKMSAKTLNALKSGDENAKGDEKDKATLTTATKDPTCLKIITDGMKVGG